MRRYLVFQNGSSNKFWSVQVKGSVLTLSWGRIGTEGQRKTESAASPAAAKKKAEALVQSKLKKGYSVATKEPPATSKAPRATKTTSKQKPQPARGTAPDLPPSYVAWAKDYDWPKAPRNKVYSSREFVRKLEPESRRVQTLPGYPARLILYPPSRLSAQRKVFVRGLIPLGDLVRPEDHSHLRPFGDDTERTWICWDPSATKPSGEMLICFIDGNDGDRRTNAGYSLSKVLGAYRPRREDDY